MSDRLDYHEFSQPPPHLKGRYRLLEQIGKGAMGIVYRARDEMLERDVAIKFLAPNRLLGEEASARFLREARAVARLSHPNIMALYDVDREGIWHYLVLEYIPGQDLSATLVMRGGLPSLAETIQAMRGTLEALAYAHRQGIIHRDIKPQNILLTPAGQVKVTDFGLALVENDVRLTQEGMFVGTALYVCPEMLLGHPLDQRADLYAVGAVLYELLTGNPPYPGDNPLAVISQVLNAPVPTPRAHNSAIPSDLERVVMKLLAKRPADRYASAEDALGDLRPIVELAIAPDQRADLTQSEIGQQLLLYAALEDNALAVETERRRLAKLLETSVVESLNLMLAQAATYEQSLAANPQARMAASVLASLARQALQQARDLSANLHPTVLETLGLEPALEALVNQTIRAHGLQIILEIERLRERLPTHVELALFRAVQDALDRAIHHARASQVTIRLARHDRQVYLLFGDNSLVTTGVDLVQPARRRLQQIGAAVETRLSAGGGFEMSAQLQLDAPVQLTPREIEVLRLAAQGLSNKQIAQALSLSPRTVNFHLDNIYSKLGVSTRTEAAIYALRQGWIARPNPD